MRRSWVWLLAGCGMENGFLPPHQTEVFYQSPDEQVDILFVVDDSGSMAEEQAALAAGFSTFLAELEASSTAYRIALVSTSQDASDLDRTEFVGDPPVLNPTTDTVALFQERVILGVKGSDHEKGLQAAADALDANPGFLRDGANLVVLFVTDEDDCSDEGKLDGLDADHCYLDAHRLTPVPDLVRRISRSKREGETVRLGGILGPLDGSCPAAYAGKRYVEAIAELRGPLTKICDPDWNPLLQDLGAVAVGVVDRFVLTRPADESTLEVRVDGVDVYPDPIDGWTYDAIGSAVVFHGEGVPERGSEVVIEYDVAGGPSLL
jgi:hypothetical protein